MAPLPDEKTLHFVKETVSNGVKPDGNEIVISGISGLYPQSRSVKELSRILYEKINPITPEQMRWKSKHPEVVQYAGNVPDLDRFDAQFFRVFSQLAQIMEPILRKTLEQTFQAIYDAGVSPNELSGKNIGVFITNTYSDAENNCFQDEFSGRGLCMIGCSRAMIPNRVSYYLNLRGPSAYLNQGCTGSFAVMSKAINAIQNGECEAAIIGASDLCLTPNYVMQLDSIAKICKDGKVKSFGENADGIAKTEAINVMFLQKAKDARRVYAEVVHVKSEYLGLLRDGLNPKYGYNRDTELVGEFLRNFYDEAGVSPHLVEYVEAFGAADPDADLSELEAIDAVYCTSRDNNNPLLVGSIRSNIGSNDAASGLSSMTKVILAFETGKIAANMHCEKVRCDVPALRENRMRIVTEHEDVRLSYAAINGMSYNGTNSHILLRNQFRPKDNNRYKSAIPHIVLLSGRQEASVQSIIDDLKSRDIDPEEITLLHNVHESAMSGHLGKGFVILDTDKEQKTISKCEQVQYYDESARPLWFVYSGMGSQWTGMGAQLMKIPTFAKSIYSCHKVLEPNGIDLIHIITSDDKTIFDNILNSFVGISAIQIGLTDILTDLGLKPDKIIGHSFGELGCAYADGCITAEEMILAAYSRGVVSVETPFIHGAMAAVGIGFEQILNKIPPEIDVACHNGPDSCTISGPAEEMRAYVAQLTSQGIFAKEVPSSNIAYHSRYIASAGSHLLKHLSEVIKSPKPRSARWLSTSVPQSKWDEPCCQLSDARYHTNNLLSPVLFEEVLQLVPSNALLVEVAPHGLLQAILKRTLPECVHVPLTRRRHNDNAYFFLEAIGKLYMNGFHTKVRKLYPRVELPVSRGTPQLSHLIKWAHEESWGLPIYCFPERKSAPTCTFIISIHDDQYGYLRGNAIKGKTVFPFAGALVAVWDTLAMSLNQPRKTLPVEFRDVCLYSQPTLNEHSHLRLRVSLHRGNGQFEVLDGISKVATGYILNENPNTKEILQQNKPNEHYNTVSKKNNTEAILHQSTSNEHNNTVLESEDIYKLFQEIDYYYSGDFRSILKTETSFSEAQILWNNNWVTLLDGIIQLNALRRGGTPTPTNIQRLSIDVKENSNLTEVQLIEKLPAINARVSEYGTICGDVSLKGLRFKDLPPARRDLSHLKIVKNCSTRKISDKYNAKKSITKDKLEDEYEVTLRSRQVGDLNSLEWIRKHKLKDSGVPVTVHYAALNQRDAVIASGKTAFNNEHRRSRYGMDFSGVTENGQRVMGVVESGAACRRLRASPHLLWPVPEHWTLEDAATVPSAYMQAYYCLYLKYKMMPGGSILVQGATGALGQAVISIALAVGCEVFATVSDRRKKHFLGRLFPQIKDDHIGNSRDISFVNMVLNATKGNGCDIVFTCARGDLKNHYLRCCKYLGITFDTNQIQCQDNFMYGCANLNGCRSYMLVDFSTLISNEMYEDLKVLQALICEGIKRGVVRPLTRVTYAPSEAARAMRLLAAGRHRGRVLLKMTDAIPKSLGIRCSAGYSNLIVSDDDCFGVQLVERLIQRGATRIRLHLPNQTNYLQFKLRIWINLGHKVEIITEDLSIKDNVDNIVKQSFRLGTLEGIYVVATKTRNSKIVEHLNTMVTYLDKVARKLCPSIRYFAVLSTECTIGERTCLSRFENNLSATRLLIPHLKTVAEICDTDAVSSRAALDAVEQALQSAIPVLRVNVCPDATSLLQEIIDIVGKNIAENADEDTTLNDFSLGCDKILEIHSLLRDKYNLTIAEENLPFLTIQKIHEVEENVFKSNLKELKGLERLFSYVDPDELRAISIYAVMPTLANMSTMRGDEFDGTQTYLYIVPGLEGHHERFRVLCEGLKLPALVLQLTEGQEIGSLTDSAQKYVDILEKKAALKDNFYILGYESGVNVALEIVAILEDKGLTGTLFLVGCAPSQWRSTLEQQLPGDEAQLRASLSAHMVSLQAKSSLAASTGQRRDQAGNARTSRLCEAAYERISQALRYAPRERPLRSRIVLLHASLLGDSGCEATCEAQLQRHSIDPLTAYALPTPLPRAADDLRVAAIVNRHLAPELHDVFENTNICTSYLTQPSIFIITPTE